MFNFIKEFYGYFLIITAVIFVCYSYFNTKTVLSDSSIENISNPNFFKSFVNRENLKKRFQQYAENATPNFFQEREGKIKILIVAGHDYEYPGAIFNNLKEADLTLKIAHYLKEFLSKDPAFEVYQNRDISFLKNDYTNYFQNYLNKNIFSVSYYKAFYKNETSKKNANHKIEPLIEITPNIAPGEMLYRLYAINKWIEDNQIDIVIHIHLNDYFGRTGIGFYKGFSIYVPDKTLRNGEESQIFAKYLETSLSNKFKNSNNPSENQKIISSSELVAVGANNTIQALSALIEYGYIYEKQFQEEESFKKAAEQTYLGIIKYLTEK